MPENPIAVCLLSGGLDSAVAAAWMRDEGRHLCALTVDYGQRHRLEIETARELAASLEVEEHKVLQVDLASLGGSVLTGPGQVPHDRLEEEIGSGIPPTYVPARNTVFLSLALAWAETLNAGEIVLGANVVDYSGYPDCRPEYLEAFESMANLATRAAVEGRRTVRVRAPLLHMTKAEIVAKAVELGLDPARTWSCYDPTEEGRPCRRCDACRLREKGFRVAGVPDAVE